MLIAPRSFTLYLIFVFCVLVLVLLHHLSTFSYSVDVSPSSHLVSLEKNHIDQSTHGDGIVFSPWYLNPIFS